MAFVVTFLCISFCMIVENSGYAQSPNINLQKLKQEAKQARQQADSKKRDYEKIRVLLKESYRTKKDLEAQREPSKKELAKLLQAFKKKKSELQKLNKSKGEKEKVAQTIETRLKNIRTRINRLQTFIRTQQQSRRKNKNKVKKKSNTSKKKSPKQKTKPQKTVKQLKADLKKVTAQLKKLQKRFTKAKQELAKSNRQIAKLLEETVAQEERIQELRTMIRLSPERISAAAQSISRNRPLFEKLKKELATLENSAVPKEKLYEQAMLATGHWVSFSQQIAPILYRRCFACHNAKASKGQYNMETYAAVLKGGESGEAVEHGDADNSMLFAMIDDGSMPKESDPLTKREIQLIRKWIDTDGRLDAGLSPNAPLIEILPPVPHPKSPQTYRSGIPVTALAYSPDGKYLASSGYHEVLLWESASGKLVRRIGNLAERIYDIAYDRSGERIAVAAGTPGQWGEVKLFRAGDGSFIRRIAVSNASILTVAFSPDQSKIASAGADHTIRIHNVDRGKLLATIEDHTDWVTDLAWSPDGKKLASSSRDKSVKIFDVQKRKIEIEDELADHPNPNVLSGKTLLIFSGHTQPVNAVVFSGDGKLLASAGADRIIRIWNSQTGKLARQIRGIGGEIHRLSVTPDNKIVSSSSDRSVRIHQFSNGKLLQTLRGQTDWVTAVAFSPVTKTIASGAFNGQIRIWESKKGELKKHFQAVPK